MSKPQQNLLQLITWEIFIKWWKNLCRHLWIWCLLFDTYGVEIPNTLSSPNICFFQKCPSIEFAVSSHWYDWVHWILRLITRLIRLCTRKIQRISNLGGHFNFLFGCTTKSYCKICYIWLIRMDASYHNTGCNFAPPYFFFLLYFLKD